MKIKLQRGDAVLHATLYDHPAAKDFISLLPLTLTLRDYARTEKIADLPRRLTTQDAPAGHKPSVGDLTYYAPWGNLAIFYRDFHYADGLVPLGKIDSGLDSLLGKGSDAITISLSENP